MFEWNRLIQFMLDAIEENIRLEADENLILDKLAEQLGYSKFHTTRCFKKLTQITFKDYLRRRRLAYAVIDLRDSEVRIIDIAMRYGFSSHEAFSRAFKNIYGISPGLYRKQSVPLVLQNKINTFDRHLSGTGEILMSKKDEKKVIIEFITLPAHKFLHIKNYQSKGYFDFWKLQEKIPGQDCDTICGLLDSIKGKLDGEDNVIGQYSGQIMAYIYEPDGRTAEAYGIRLPADHRGTLPAQMLCIDVPESEYVVFEYPAFNYETECEKAYLSVDAAEKNFDINKTPYIPERQNNRVSYLFFMPEKYLKILRPIRRLTGRTGNR